jgi:MFS family permease
MAATDIDAEIDQNFKYNFRVNVLDGTFFWFGASFFATRTIAPLFLSYLTDNTFAFGLLSMIASTGWLLPQLFTANWVQRVPVKKVIPVNHGFFWERLPVLLLPLAALATLWSSGLAITLFLLFIGWHVIGAGIIAVGWQELIAKIFPVEWRGRFFGISNFVGNGTGILGATAAAWMLDTIAYPYNFMIAFGMGGLFIFLSWVFLGMTREPADEIEETTRDNKSYWRSLPRILKTDKNYRRYLFSQVLSSVGYMAVGFLTVYAIQKWQVSAATVSLYTTSMLVGNTVSNPLFGWMGDKLGHKKVILISTLLTTAGIGVALVAPSPAWFYLVFGLLGANQAGFIISGINIVFEFAEKKIRPTYIGLTNSIIGLVAAIAPLIGSAIVENVSYQSMFTISVLFGLGSVIFLLLFVKEPRRLNLEIS